MALIALNSDKTAAICIGTNQRRQSLSTLRSIQVAKAYYYSVTLSDHIKLLGVTLDSRLSFDKNLKRLHNILLPH